MNEDQKDINITMQQMSKFVSPLITDVKTNEKGEISVTYDDGKTITLDTSLLDNANQAELTVTSAATNDRGSYIGGYYRDYATTAATTAGRLDATTAATTAKTIGYYWPESNPNIITSSSWTTYSSTPPVYKKYFIEDKANFSWIVSKFMKTYVSNLNNTSSLESIIFFGLKNGEEKTLSLTLKAIDTSVKAFFDLAATTARQNTFDELFGPLTDELSEEDYIERVEDSGVFIKELYDENSLIELVKTHKIEISKKINHKNKQRIQTGVLEDDDDDEGWFSKAPWDITTPKTEVIDNLNKDIEDDASSHIMSDLWKDPRTFLVQSDHVIKYGPSSTISCSNISNISSVTQGPSASSGVSQCSI